MKKSLSVKWEKYKKYKERKNDIPNVLENIRVDIKDINYRLATVEREMKPNGGGSMRDTLRIVKAEIEANFWLNPYPSFRMTSKKGNNMVNEAYCHLCKTSSESLLKLGWKNFVENQDELDKFIARWEASENTHSQYSGELKFKNKDGESVGTWMVKLRPLGSIENEDDYLWHGTMVPLDKKAIEIAQEFNIPLA